MLSLLLPSLLAGCSPTCRGVDGACHAVDDGRYIAEVPADWDGQSSLDAVVFFHGYSSSGAGIRDRLWDDGAAETGLLYLFPDGLDETWSHVGSPSSARDELAFYDSMMADAAARWPLGRRYVSGFSQGGSMAWDIACYRGDTIDAAFPASGAFWEPLPAACDDPVALRHTHGLADQTVPMEGRPIGSSMQGDVYEGIAVWKQANGCADAPDQEVADGPSVCSVWSCSSGRALWLCLHDGEHRTQDGWLGRNVAWAAQQ